MNKVKIGYLTYQTFPAETANSLQTISNVRSFVRNNCEVELIFPLREKDSSGDIDKLKSFYEFSEDFKVCGVEHKYPFGKIRVAEKLLFHISHFLWSKKVFSTIKTRQSDYDVFITRSDWIFYFMSKNQLNVIFEIHQLSKVRKLILRVYKNDKNSKVVLLNQLLKEDLKNYIKNENSIVLQNGVNLSDFKILKKEKIIIFVGSLKRFESDRDLAFIIDGFMTSGLEKSYKLMILGGPSAEADRLKNYVDTRYSNSNIEITGRVSRSEVVKYLSRAEIGVLINSDENLHSVKYTSPLKYFEYVASELKVVAIDFPSHRELPFSEHIKFFNDGDLKNFSTQLRVASFSNLPKLNKDIVSLDTRSKKILDFYNL